MVQPLWRRVCRFLKKLKIELPYDPAIPLLGIYLEKNIIHKDRCNPMFMVYHVFLTRSSVDGHLGCFHVLATVNSAAMNIGVHISFRIIVLSGYMPRSGIAGSYRELPKFLMFIFRCFSNLFHERMASEYMKFNAWIKAGSKELSPTNETLQVMIKVRFIFRLRFL